MAEGHHEGLSMDAPVLWEIPIPFWDGHSIPINNSLIMYCLAVLVLVVVLRLATRKMERIPYGLQNFVEWVFESLYNFIEGLAGKKLTKISLLSGGERALTAIAILFAILKARPMPFCILDEIEAALDDANVDRFASYLKRFAEETQFIVITHRKPTMNQADSLFGVTMQEKGVSKIVSVKLSEVESKLGEGTVE